MHRPRVEVGSREGVSIWTLVAASTTTSPQPVEAQVCPAAGGCVVSLRVGTAQLLHLPLPLGQFVAAERTGGIPLLHPFANRLHGHRIEVEGRRIDADLSPFRHADSKGRPMHGFLLRWPGREGPGWAAEPRTDHEMAELSLSIEWAEHRELYEAFPFPHRLVQRYRLRPDRFEVGCEIHARDAALPASFGWHPYLTLPGAARGDLRLTLPQVEPIPLDAEGFPMAPSPRGAVEPAAQRPIAERAWDDLFRVVAPPSTVRLDDGRRTVEVRLGATCRFLQIYSPAGADFVAIEPMTAPTAALETGGPDLSIVPAGGVFRAGFEIAWPRCEP